MAKRLKTYFVRFAIIYIAVLMCASLPLSAQLMGPHNHSHTSGTGHKVEVAPSYAWKLLPPLGLREPASIDTLMLNYSRQFVPSEVSDAWATTGNFGAEGINMIYYQRPAISNFFLSDALAHWLPSENKMKFYNTRIPMTLVSFSTAGGRTNSQERLAATFSGNINAKAQVGAMVDYLYSKGCYENQAAKNLSWGLSGSYLGDRYEFQGYFYHYNLVNKENGGIKDMLYITDPAVLQGGITTIDPKAIPTNLRNAHTRVRGQELLLNNRYKVGYWHEEEIDDSTTHRTYIPVSSFIYTLKFREASHLFIDKSPGEIGDFFDSTYLNPYETYDNSSMTTLDNIVGISLLEGFNKYAKFGFSVFLRHQLRNYRLPADTLDRAALDLTPFPENFTFDGNRKNEQLIWAGGQLTKQQGSLLTYEATAELGLAGPAAGEVKADGVVGTRFPLFGDSVRIRATGSFRNEEAPFLTKIYRSNHFIWQNDFGKTRTFELGGTLDLDRTDTHLRAGVTDMQNYIYFGTDATPRQYGGHLQVLSLSLKQNFRAGILHWDNSVTYQTSTNTDILSLPVLTVYSNLYILFKLATLHVQLGLDCDYYTRYYAPAYQPATATFYNQHDIKIGNYPFCNVYANMKLGKTRFYVLFSHLNQGLIGGNNYFSSPYYPLNPRRFQIGLSVDFTN